ncbi:MAG: DUF5018 domain-containing protein [Betaproteobacteria bacterium]|nr:DUF5018 domain-containing protein [Betaproteobacteria bacterium]
MRWLLGSVLLATFVAACGGGGGGSTGGAGSTASSANQITSYYIAASVANYGTIDEVNKTIAVTVPSGTSLTALIATFTVSSGATVTVNGTTQVSGQTINNFTNPVVYTVRAQDGSTASYTVTVTVTSSGGGTGGGGTGGGGTLVGSCDVISAFKQCTDYTGSNYSAVVSNLTSSCTSLGGTWQTATACTNANRVGGCTLQAGTPNEDTTWFYSPTFTTAFAQSYCTSSGGVFVP